MRRTPSPHSPRWGRHGPQSLAYRPQRSTGKHHSRVLGSAPIIRFTILPENLSREPTWRSGTRHAFPLTHAIGIDEGGEVRDTSAWTGTGNDGNQFHPLGGSDAAKGWSIQTNAAWTANQVRPPEELYSLYAISGVLTVVPEPGSIFLTGHRRGWAGRVVAPPTSTLQARAACRQRPPLTQVSPPVARTQRCG